MLIGCDGNLHRAGRMPETTKEEAVMADESNPAETEEDRTAG